MVVPMQTSFFSEVKSSFGRLLIIAKVEKYIPIGNQWLLETSGKALEQAHRVAQRLRGIELGKHITTGKDWLLETPERALNHAYDTAVILKKIEDEYFAGNPVTSISNYGDSVSTYFQLVSRKCLLLIQIRLLEFQTSHLLGDVQGVHQQILENKAESHSILDKLKFIDQVLTRYQVQPGSISTPVDGSDFATDQTIAVQSRSVGHLTTNVGFASMIFVGGLAIGGLSSWLLLSVQNHADNGNKRLHSIEMRPDRAQAEATNPGIIARPSPPETLFPESNISEHRSQTDSGKPPSTKLTTSRLYIVAPTNTARKHSSKSTATRYSLQTHSRKSLSRQSTPPHAPRVLPSSITQKRRLTQADLQGRSAWELTIMRNEIYARHGRQFYEPELKRHFERQGWYHPQYAPGKFPVALLSEIEMYNATLIRDYQHVHQLF
jgi:hypothetical protein